MKNILSSFEIGFWAIWFSVPFFFGIFSDNMGPHLIYLIGLFVFGASLAGIGYILRSKERARYLLNISMGLLFFILYLMIGYPNLIRPNGERPLGPLILLLAIGLMPIMSFWVLRLWQRNIVKQQSKVDLP